MRCDVVKLTWQMTILYAIAMIIMGSIIIIGFYNEAAAEMKWPAITVLGTLLGFGGGKMQTVWEIRQSNNGGSHAGPTQPTERE